MNSFLKLEPECGCLQDTPGIYEEGAVADAVASFIKEGNEEYMEFEQASLSFLCLAAFPPLSSSVLLVIDGLCMLCTS